MKTCPYCAEDIADSVVTCPYCGSNVNDPPRTASTGIGNDAGMRMLMPVGRSGWAIASGYLGLFSLLIFPAPLALLTGVVALMHLKKNPKLHGMGRAVFGLAMGALGTLVLALAVTGVLLEA